MCIRDSLGVIGAPETYVVNANGQVLARHRGVLNEEIFAEKLKPLLVVDRDYGHH